MSLTRGLTRELTRGLTRGIDRVAGVVDADFSDVVLLLDFAGADGATDTTDLSNSAHVETFTVNAEVNDEIQFLGVNTLDCSTGGHVTFADHADWDFGTGDFTVELGVYHTSWSGIDGFIGAYDTPNGWWFRWNTTGDLLEFGVGDTVLASGAWTPVNSTFYHAAVSRSGTDLRIFIDGVQRGSTATDSTDLTGSTEGLALQGIREGTQAQNGHTGAVRITKGVGRYVGNFTALTEFYPTS